MGRVRKVVDTIEDDPDPQNVPKAALFIGGLLGGVFGGLASGGNPLAITVGVTAGTGLIHRLFKVDTAHKGDSEEESS